MLSIIVILSDIPLYIAQWISELTGADMSGFVDGFNSAFAGIIEALEQLLG